MSDLELKALRRLNLRVGITRYVSASHTGRYLGQVRNNFYTYTDEEFAGIVEEMVADGSLAKVTGRFNGIKLVRAETPHQENNNG